MGGREGGMEQSRMGGGMGGQCTYAHNARPKHSKLLALFLCLRLGPRSLVAAAPASRLLRVNNIYSDQLGQGDGRQKKRIHYQRSAPDPLGGP